MKKVIIFSLFLLFTFQVQAQKDFRRGYLVNLQGDTLKGELNYKGDIKSALECQFRATATAKEEVFKPQELLGYGFTGGKFYESKKAKIVKRFLDRNEKVAEAPVTGNDSVNFMEVMVKGYGTLYFMKDADSQPHFFLQKGKNAVQELVYVLGVVTDPATGIKRPYQSKLYVGTLKVAFADCALIWQQVEKTDYKL